MENHLNVKYSREKICKKINSEFREMKKFQFIDKTVKNNYINFMENNLQACKTFPCA